MQVIPKVDVILNSGEIRFDFSARNNSRWFDQVLLHRWNCVCESDIAKLALQIYSTENSIGQIEVSVRRDEIIGAIASEYTVIG